MATSRWCACWLCALGLQASPSPGYGAPPILEVAGEPLTLGCAPAGAGPRGAPVRGVPLVVAAAGGHVFQAGYDGMDWSGHFERFPLLSDAGGRLAGAAPLWDAGAILTGAPGQAPRPAPGRRRIYTAIVQPDGTLAMAPFVWAALSDAQRALLDQAPAGGARGHVDALGEERLDYLRGERAMEGAPFRRRSSVLGDAVHGTPVYVGVAAAMDAGPDYAAFYAHSKLRRPAVYLGTNDGMLHGFDAADGTELFAYVPDSLMGGLNQLTSPGYAHRAYVDGPASAAEARLGGVWKTVLVAAMGGGAQGVFALDVSDPDHFDAGGGVLWEFTDRDDPMMGNVTSLPQVARVRTGRQQGQPVYRYFAVVASGANNYRNDGHRSAAGDGALFLLALDKAHAAPWQRNVNYYRLVTPIADPGLANALGAPALVRDGDGALQYAYGGDLQGNLWRFDFSGAPPWSRAVGPGPGGTPLFVARDAAGRRQPIAQQPRLVFAAGGGYLVLFGTGRLIERADRTPASYAPQSYYGILDRLADPPEVVDDRRALTARVLGGAAGAATLNLSGDAIEPGAKGWYLDFAHTAETGERSLGAAAVMGGRLFFNTMLPGRDVCAAAGSRAYVLDVLSGLGADAVAVAHDGGADTGQLRPDFSASPVLVPGAASPVRRRAPLRVVSVAVVGFAANDAARARQTGSVVITVPVGRISWREVANWRALHAAAKH